MMNRIRKETFKPIDQEEKDLMESIERDEWQPVKKFDQERNESVMVSEMCNCNGIF